MSVVTRSVWHVLREDCACNKAGCDVSLLTVLSAHAVQTCCGCHLPQCTCATGTFQALHVQPFQISHMPQALSSGNISE